MTVLADTYWDVDGTALNTYAYSIEDLDGLTVFPRRRGDNQPVPFRPGAIWVPKTLDQTVRTMLMWVSWKDADGNSAATRALRWGQFEVNKSYLKRLIYSEEKQRRFTQHLFNAAGAIVTRYFDAEAVGGLQLAYAENDYFPSARFTVDLLCADPYMYGGTAVTATAIAKNAAHTVDNVGDETLSKMTITLNGPLVDPILTNSTYNPDVWLKYTGTIAAGKTVVLDTSEFTATHTDNGNVVGNVTHAGTHFWMAFAPGNNTVTLTASSGAGTWDMTGAPVY